jgi:hypothetical protein
MSAIPIAGPGIGIVRNNMKDAHNHGEPRDMALPLTYYWFYQKVRNKGPGTISNLIPIGQHLGILILALRDMRLVFPQRFS